jgi:Holliday junction resolvasome RuvABC endonuclease subunit
MIVAGIDIGFRNSGIVIFDVDGDQMKYVASACISPKKPKKAKYVALADADMLKQSALAITDMLRKYNVQRVSFELPTGGALSARANRGLAFATCMCVYIPLLLNIESSFVTPREVKLAATGDQWAEKDAVIAAVAQLFPEVLDHPKTKQEHIADAAGVAMADIDFMFKGSK